MTQAMTPDEFVEQVNWHDEDIRRTSDAYAEAKRDKINFIQEEAPKLLGINPGDEVYVFPSQSWPREKMQVERVEYWGKSPSGELSFVLRGKRILRSGSVGKTNIATSVFVLSQANDYKVR